MALIEPGANGLIASEHKDARPCVVCGHLTKHRVGRRKSPTAWAWRSPRCADIAGCTTRRHQPRPTDTDHATHATEGDAGRDDGDGLTLF